MRAHAILLALLFVAPVAASLATPAPVSLPLDLDVPRIEEVQGDISDARLVYLLGTSVGFDLKWPPATLAVPEAPLSVLALGMGLRAGLPVSAEDVAAFDGLDAQIAVPVGQLLVAMDAAWTLRDAAFAGLTEAEQLELRDILLRGEIGSVRYHELRANVDMEPLYDAAILLLDTLENIVLPQLQEAAALDIWPATAVADPVGVLRIGGTGNDLEHLNRILQIDPRGDDTYRNNAGGGTMLAGWIEQPTTFKAVVAVSVDLHGNDRYLDGYDRVSQGGGLVGIGVLYDLAGDDAFDCVSFCQGGGGAGIGIARDFEGDDAYLGSGRSNGGGDTLGILREEGGNDGYWVNTWAGGHAATPTAIGLLWDRGGYDQYQSRIKGFADSRYGWGKDGGWDWLVDEGASIDFYETADPIFGQDTHGCNDCDWVRGTGFTGLPVGGRGNDNAGGLYEVLRQTQEDYS